MQDRLRSYMDELFADAPQTSRVVELKEEILQNLTDKYNDLLAEGKTEEAAYNIAIASIGDVQELLENLKELEPEATKAANEATQRYRKQSAILVSLAIAFYIISPVPCIIFPGAVIGPVLLLIMVALATGLLIYSGMTKPKLLDNDGTVVEEFKEWKEQNSARKQAYNAVSSALWALAVVVYVAVSFVTSAWHITWLIFLITAAVGGVVKAIFDLKK